MGALIMADPASKSTYAFTDQAQAEIGISQYGYIPILDDGSVAKVVQFEGAALVQGAPINAWIGDIWYDGQKEIVQSLVSSGQVPMPPARIWNLPVVATPPELLQTYASAKGVPQAKTLLEAYQTGHPIGAGGNTWLWIAAAGLGLLAFIPRRKKAAASAQDGL